MIGITSIGTAVPKYAFRQEGISENVAVAIGLEGRDKKKFKLYFNQAGVETRHSVLPDFSGELDSVLFGLGKDPSIDERMLAYEKHALPLCQKAINDSLQVGQKATDATHLITVSCTGMAAPGLDIALVQALGLSTDIYRTSVNFMGCYAGIHALKQASFIVNKEPEAKVLIVCVELCSLHFQRKNDADNTLANMLFADGAAAIWITSAPQSLLTVHDFYSDIQFEGLKEMAWRISSLGFLMTLSSYIPQLMHANIKGLFARACAKFGINLSEIGYWAVHPGGKKILDVIGQQLELPSDSLKMSYDTLKQYGNMSSVTIFFVLQAMLRVPVEPNKNVVIAGFGPGLTTEIMLLKTV